MVIQRHTLFDDRSAIFDMQSFGLVARQQDNHAGRPVTVLCLGFIELKYPMGQDVSPRAIPNWLISPAAVRKLRIEAYTTERRRTLLQYFSNKVRD